MKLYKISCQLDLAAVGAYPQVCFYSIDGVERPYDNVWATRTKLVMRGDMSVGAKRTSLLSCIEISPGRGLLVDDALLACLVPTVSQSCRQHPFEVAEPMENLVHASYTFLEVGTTWELLDFIDYERSSFCRTLFGDLHSDVQVASSSDWNAQQQHETQAGSSLTIAPRKLHVRRGCFERIGIFKLPSSAIIYATEVTARRIEAFTGVRLTEEHAISIDQSW